MGPLIIDHTQPILTENRSRICRHDGSITAHLPHRSTAQASSDKRQIHRKHYILGVILSCRPAARCAFVSFRMALDVWLCVQARLLAQEVRTWVYVHVVAHSNLYHEYMIMLSLDTMHCSIHPLAISFISCMSRCMSRCILVFIILPKV